MGCWEVDPLIRSEGLGVKTSRGVQRYVMSFAVG